MTEDTSFPEALSPGWCQFFGVLYFIFGIGGLYQSFTIFVAFLGEQRVPAVKKVIHINLAIANIFVVIGFPFSGSSSFSERWLFGDTGCQMYGLLTFTGGIAAVGFVALLGFERYLANCWKESYDKWSPHVMWGLCLLNWTHATLWAIAPLIGWSRYTVEDSQIACGIDWTSSGFNHVTYMVILVIDFVAMMGLGLFFLWMGNRCCDESPAKREASKELFTESQLIWLTGAFNVFVMIGWGPYPWYGLYGAYHHGAFAAALPPLFAKGLTNLYLVGYLAASGSFRSTFWSRSAVIEEKQIKAQ